MLAIYSSNTKTRLLLCTLSEVDPLPSSGHLHRYRRNPLRPCTSTSCVQLSCFAHGSGRESPAFSSSCQLRCFAPFSRAVTALHSELTAHHGAVQPHTQPPATQTELERLLPAPCLPAGHKTQAESPGARRRCRPRLSPGTPRRLPDGFPGARPRAQRRGSLLALEGLGNAQIATSRRAPS